jgi:hypothetical protein
MDKWDRLRREGAGVQIIYGYIIANKKNYPAINSCYLPHKMSINCCLHRKFRQWAFGQIGSEEEDEVGKNGDEFYSLAPATSRLFQAGSNQNK